MPRRPAGRPSQAASVSLVDEDALWQAASKMAGEQDFSVHGGAGRRAALGSLHPWFCRVLKGPSLRVADNASGHSPAQTRFTVGVTLLTCRGFLSSAKKTCGLHSRLRDFASSCRMWLVPAHSLAPFLPRHPHRREPVPRKQLALFQERKVRPRRSNAATRAFMVLLSRFFDWREALVIVKPETFLKWHRTAYRTFWRWKSRKRGRPGLPKNLRELIREMAHENPTWGEERIADELKLSASGSHREPSGST